MAKATRKRLTRSQEDYLEAIWALVRANRVARVRDIAHRLDVGMPSVTAALKTLAERGLVNYDPYQLITLTDAGREAAQEVSRGHQVIRRFLSDVLGMDAKSADANACRMEHAADKALLERLSDFVEFFASCPLAGVQQAKFLAGKCATPPSAKRCGKCVTRVTKDVAKLSEGS